MVMDKETELPYTSRFFTTPMFFCFHSPQKTCFKGISTKSGKQ